MKIPACILIVLCLVATPSKAQLIDFLSLGTDSTCINDRSDRLLVRIFGMQKFNTYTLGEQRAGENLTYRANNNYHLGLGFHYKWIGANVTFKLPYFNNNNYGKTKFFDLQSYLYLNSIAIDLYVLSYRGYYFADNHLLNPQPQSPRLIRKDLYVGNYGLNFQYIFNYKKFSYRAAFIQNQCQIRSAGSPIVGGGIHYTRARADSAIVPNTLNDIDFFGGSNFNKTGVFSIGVNGGYAYTYVFARNFFATAAVLVGAGINYSALKTDATDYRDSRVNGQLHTILRGALGYNTNKYYIGLQYNNYISRNNMPVIDSWQQLQAGNLRLTFAKRFQLKQKTAETFEEIEDKILPEF